GNSLSVDTTLMPTVAWDVDLPDLGYHYDPLDYVFTNMVVGNCTLLLTNGVALGMNVYPGNYAFRLNAGAKIISQGSPTRPNVLVRPYSVQEQPSMAASGWGPTFRDDAPAFSPLAEVRLRYTLLPLHTTAAWHFYGGGNVQTFAMSDCQVLGGAF